MTVAHKFMGTEDQNDRRRRRFGFYPPLNREDFTSFHIQIIGSAVSFETVDRYANEEEFVHKRENTTNS